MTAAHMVDTCRGFNERDGNQACTHRVHIEFMRDRNARGVWGGFERCVGRIMPESWREGCLCEWAEWMQMCGFENLTVDVIWHGLCGGR